MKEGGRGSHEGGEREGEGGGVLFPTDSPSKVPPPVSPLRKEGRGGPIEFSTLQRDSSTLCRQNKMYAISYLTRYFI